MENHRNQDQQSSNQNEQRHNRSGAPSGFDGMNFEEQRGSFQNMNAAGDSQEQGSNERDGHSAPAP